MPAPFRRFLEGEGEGEKPERPAFEVMAREATRLRELRCALGCAQVISPGFIARVSAVTAMHAGSGSGRDDEFD